MCQGDTVSRHGVLGCSSLIRAIVLQGELADKGVCGRIVPSLYGYAVKVTHFKGSARRYCDESAGGHYATALG